MSDDTQAFRFDPDDLYGGFESKITKTTMGQPILTEPAPLRKPTAWDKFTRFFVGKGQRKKPRKGMLR